ncbi:MAG: agmatinase [Alphaproteobacteria bacterium]
MPAHDGFLGLGAGDAVSYQDARAVIVPFGLEATVSYGGGTAKGPAAIIEASHQVELFDEELWREPFRDWGIVTLTEPAIDGGSVAAALDQLAGITSAVVEDRKFPLVLGGEHSLTAGAIRPHLTRHDDLVVLHFDGHADLRDGYEGEHWSHAAAMRRVLDDPVVELVSVGIRNISAGEIPFLEANRGRITVYWAKDRRQWDLDAIARELAGRTIYLTFDLDGFDSSVMPATGTPEPGGLTWDDVMTVIKCAGEAGTIVGADVCELAPIDNLHAPNFLAAKLGYKILCYALGEQKDRR